MLRTSGSNIVDQKGNKIVLHAIGIGGWLMMEGYMLGGKNIAEHIFKSNIKKLYGQQKLDEFIGSYQKNFFNEKDVKRIKDLGFNCARLPFNHRILNTDAGYKMLDKIIGWFKKYKVYLILDLHATPGSQNYDWHSDSDGVAKLWDNNKYIHQTIAIWDRLSKRYKDEDIIAGYDILNETVTKKTNKMNDLYSKIIGTIRKNNDKHVIFVEPNNWAQDFKGINKPDDDNFAWSIHFYLPVNFTFNWNPMLTRPSRSYLKKELSRYRRIQIRDNVPMFVGEFGVASRCPVCNSELSWVKDTLSIFKGFGWSWSYWTYKSVAGALVPDGLYRIFDQEMFQRGSNEPGMENIYKILKTRSKRFYRILDTKNFTLHKELYKVISGSLLFLIMIFLISSSSFAKTIDWNIDGCYTGAFIRRDSSNVTSGYDISRYQDMAGKKCAIISSYMAFQYDGVPYSFPKDIVDTATENGSVLLLTWEPRDWDESRPRYFKESLLPDIVDGKYDTYIDSWAADIKNLDNPILLRFAPEMNISNLSWCGINNGGRGKGPETYIKAFRHVHERFDAMGIKNVVWVWTPINWGLPFEPWNHYSNYYPGDQYVDVIAMDEYNWGTSQSWSKWTNFNDTYWKFYSELTHLYPDKPLIIGEFSCSDSGGDKPSWIKDSFTAIKNDFPGIKAFIWFSVNNKNRTVNNLDENSNWAIDSDPGSGNAMKDAMKDPYFIDTISYKSN